MRQLIRRVVLVRPGVAAGFVAERVNAAAVLTHHEHIAERKPVGRTQHT